MKQTFRVVGTLITRTSETHEYGFAVVGLNQKDGRAWAFSKTYEGAVSARRTLLNHKSIHLNPELVVIKEVEKVSK